VDIQFDPALKELLLWETGDPLGEKNLPHHDKIIPVVIRLRNAQESINIPDLQVISKLGHIVTGRIPVSGIVQLRQHSAVASLKASKGFRLELDHSIEEIQAKPKHFQWAGLPSYQGNGVVVGIIDWGIDHAHHAFRNTDGSTRIKAIWDQRGGSHPQSPQPFNYGRLITEVEINQSLSEANPYRALNYDPAKIDPSQQGTHGTHVASIAAGSGQFPGVAPKADIVFVHLKSADTRPEDTLGDSVRLLEAVDFIFKYAGDKPAVVNLSLGRTGDAKDGSSPVEQGLDAVVNEKPGRAICMSTGNYYNARLHAEGQCLTGETQQLRWQVPMMRKQVSELEIWYSGNDHFVISLIDSRGEKQAEVDLGETKILKHRGRIYGSIYHRYRDPNNFDNQVNIFIQPRALGGIWQIEITADRSDIGEYHAWIERTTPRDQSRFHPQDASNRSTIGTICTGHATISCGSYRAADPYRRLGSYSSAGPSRDLRQIPVISAPGDKITAAKSSTLDFWGYRSKLSEYVAKSGTSMAAPHCTGVIALMMEAALPNKLSVAEIREILKATSRPAPHQFIHDDLRYGAGLLDATGAVNAAYETFSNRFG